MLYKVEIGSSLITGLSVPGRLHKLQPVGSQGIMCRIKYLFLLSCGLLSLRRQY